MEAPDGSWEIPQRYCSSEDSPPQCSPCLDCGLKGQCSGGRSSRSCWLKNGDSSNEKENLRKENEALRKANDELRKEVAGFRDELNLTRLQYDDVAAENNKLYGMNCDLWELVNAYEEQAKQLLSKIERLKNSPPGHTAPEAAAE